MLHFIRFFVKSTALSILIVFATHAMAQSSTTGLVTGVVTDSSGSVVPGSQVTLTNAATSATQQQTTNAEGSYRFSLFRPQAIQSPSMRPALNPSRARFRLASVWALLRTSSSRSRIHLRPSFSMALRRPSTSRMPTFPLASAVARSS